MIHAPSGSPKGKAKERDFDPDRQTRLLEEHEFVVAQALQDLGVCPNPFETYPGGHGGSSFSVIFLFGPWTRDALLATMPAEDVYGRTLSALQGIQLLGALFGLVMLEMGTSSDRDELPVSNAPGQFCRFVLLFGGFLFLLSVFHASVMYTSINTVPRHQLRSWLTENSGMFFRGGNMAVCGFICLIVSVALKLGLIYSAEDEAEGGTDGFAKRVIPLVTFVVLFVMTKICVVSAVEYNQTLVRPWRQACDKNYLKVVFCSCQDLHELLRAYLKAATSNADIERLDEQLDNKPAPVQTWISVDIDFIAFRLHVVSHFAARREKLAQLSFLLIEEVWNVFESLWLQYGGHKSPSDVAAELWQGSKDDLMARARQPSRAKRSGRRTNIPLDVPTLH